MSATGKAGITLDTGVLQIVLKQLRKKAPDLALPDVQIHEAGRLPLRLLYPDGDEIDFTLETTPGDGGT